MHEQDVRRAVGMPGGMDSPAAEHTADYLAESLGLRARPSGSAPPAGTTVVLEIAGHAPYAFTVDENGRGERLTDLPADPTVRLQTDRESFIVLAGGRRTPEPGVGRRHRRHRSRTADPRHPGGHPVTTKPDLWSLSDMPDQDGPDLPGHRHHPRRPRLPRRARAGPPRRPGGPRRPEPRRSWPRPRPRSAGRSRAPTLEQLRRRPRRPRLGTPGGGARRVVRPDRRAGQQRRRDGAAVRADRRRLRAADGDQPLRAVPADRPAAARCWSRARAARVVTVSSIMHKTARTPPLGDPRQQSGRYQRWPVYGETKLANLLFTYELDRRCREAELPVKALAAHPGFAGHPPRRERPVRSRRPAGAPRSSTRRSRWSPSPAHSGALPMLMAATADLPGGDVLRAEQRSAQTRGLPAVVDSTRALPRRARPARAVGAQRAHRGSRVPLTQDLRSADRRPRGRCRTTAPVP